MLPPLAVKVVLLPIHIVGALGLTLIVGSGLTVTVTVWVWVQELASVPATE